MKPYVLFLFFLCSCAGDREVAGFYWSNKSPYRLRINRDSTFTYEYRFQFRYEHAAGIWRKESRHKYILNSFVKSKRLPISAHEEEIDTSTNINFLSVDIQIPDQTYYRCGIFINDTLYENRSCDSLAFIAIAVPIKSFFLGISADDRIPGRLLDTLYTQKLYPQSKYGRRLKVGINYNDSLFNYRIFDNKAIRIGNNKIWLYNNKDSTVMLLQKS